VITAPRAGRRAGTSVALALIVGTALGACAAPPALDPGDDRLQVVTTTGILRDLAQNVGGDRVAVTSLVPAGADPHSYEPSLRDVRNVVYADVAFSNYALLEEHNVIKTLDANLRDDVTEVSLAEGAVKYAADIIPLVEDVSLDTVWLGLRARGDGDQFGADRSSDVLISATAATGPGDVFGYLTGSFGDTEVYFDSSDGFDAGTGYRDDTATLPADAHTHMSWVFTKPGIHTLTLAASIKVSADSKPVPIGESTFTFAVGVDPLTAGIPDPVVLEQGHADLTVDLDDERMAVLFDPEGGGENTQQVHTPDTVVIDVPNKAIAEVPAGQQFGFLGRTGEPIHQLPQAVLGKHVHGEIDPHLWQNVRNAMAYAELMRDSFIAADPEGAREYRDNTAAYLQTLDETDTYVRERIGEIPESLRNLVTTHDAFAYLADAYGLEIAGFVTPNPAVEPSLADRRKLTQSIRNLGVSAVFLEPNLAARSSTLTEVAREQGVEICPIYGDTFDDTVTDYIGMMRFNADSVARCLNRP
jgi:anchored repeat ABC transporter substrate-binding protein